MDKGLFIRELAEQLGVTEDTVINKVTSHVKGGGCWFKSHFSRG